MRVAEGGNDEAADERGGQNAGEDAGPAERSAEGKFPAPAGPDDEGRGFARVHAALAEAAHRPVANDQQKEEQDTVERFFEVAGVEAAGGACGGEIGEEKPGGGQKKPRQRTETLEKSHLVAPKEKDAPWMEIIRAIRCLPEIRRCRTGRCCGTCRSGVGADRRGAAIGSR